MKVFCRSPFNYDRDEASIESGLSCHDPSLTKQAFADECDINTIVRNFGLTGQLPDNVRAPQYGDFTSISDYKSALNAVIAAEDAFMELPANVRARFHHDPQALLEFCSNPDNRDEAIKLGLVVAPASSNADAGGPSGGPQATGGAPKAQEGV